MPFLAPLIPALVGGAASALGGAAVNAAVGGLSGTGTSAKAAGLQSPFTTEQAKAAQGQQSQAFNQNQSAINQQQALANQLAAQGGIQNQADVYGQQQALANQLGLMATGQAGPSVAQAQLANATGQNVANQAALMAGQRGAGANAGLIARQAAMQGGAMQQGAAGQAAALRAQEQLNAIGALQSQQGMLGNLATQQVGQQTGAIGNLNQFGQQNLSLAQQQQANMLQAQNQANANLVGDAGQQNQSNVKYNEQANKTTAGLVGGLGNTISTGVQKLFAEGGQVGQQAILKENYSGPRSKIGQHLTSYAKGGKVDALVSPGEIYLTPEKARKAAEGKISPLEGERIKGTAKVPGDSYINDTVEKKLSPGGVVIPRTKAKTKEDASRFLAEVLSKKGKR